MDKLEYIPGDLVNWWATGKPMRLDGVYYKKKKDKVYYTREEENNNTMLYSDEDIKPIPLTPEILEKNGWKSINGKYALKIKNANYLVLDFTEDGIYTYINERTMLFVIKYVHQLQNLLYGLELNSEMEV